MLPLDNEFSLLYILYLTLFIYILYSAFKSSKNRFGLITIAIVSVILNLILYSDADNFKGGGSLGVLFYSGILLIITVVAVIVNNIILNRKK